MSDGGQRVLVIDDDDRYLRALKRSAPRGMHVVTARTQQEALAVIAEAPPDIAVVDLLLGHVSGLDLIGPLKERGPTRVVITSAKLTPDRTIRAVRAGADDVVAKPTSLDVIARRLANGGPVGAENRDDPTTLAQSEWDLVHRTVDECGGNQSEAARRLKVSRGRLARTLAQTRPGH